MKNNYLLLLSTFFLLSLGIYAQNAGNALDFDGTDDEIDAGDINALDGLSALTIEVWVNLDAHDNADRFVVKEAAGNTVGWGMGLTGGSGNKILLIARNGSNVKGTSSSSIPLNTWVHLAYVFDGSGATNGDRLKCYINGTPDVLSIQNTVPANLNSNSQTVQIGRGSNTGGDFLDGKMDEVRIWNIARSEAEIRDNMHKDLVPANESNLVVYYKFDESIGTSTITDSKGSNNGTWSGNSGANTMSNFQTSNAVLGDAMVQNQNEIRADWQATGTSNSLACDGLTMSVGTALAETNYAVFGHDQAGIGTTPLDLGSSAAVGRYHQTWYVAEEGIVADVTTTFDLGIISETGLAAGTASNYILLYRSGTTGDFSDVTAASSIMNTDQVLLTGIALQDGYYTLGSSNLSTSPLSLNPLPIEMLFFVAKRRKDSVRLEWATAAEINNDRFEIQRSKDGKTWVSLGYISGYGNSIETSNYSFIDQNPVNGGNYYRLKQIDFDGKFEYSEIINVEFTSNDIRVQIFPNPTQEDDFTLYIPEYNSELYEMRIYDLTGREVFQQSLSAARTKIDTFDFEKGLYLVKVEINGIATWKKVMIQ